MTKLRQIGVLGGMGPEATVALMQRLQAATPARDDADHVPLLVDMNPQVPSRIRHLIEKTGPNPGPDIADMAARLEAAGAEALIMPCDTAHHYAPHITENVQIPFLNMPVLTCAALASQFAQGSKVGILASPATNQIGLFQAHLNDVGFVALFPQDEEAVLSAIRRIKRSGPDEADIALLQEKSAEFVAQGAVAVLIGCTEFSLFSEQIKTTVPVVDALDVLVVAALSFAGVDLSNPV
jgi:aspartate racemase